MSDLAVVLFFATIGSVFSLLAGLMLLVSKKSANKLVLYATPFAAGALLSAAFVDLLRSSARNGQAESALMWTLIGIILFFLLEHFLHWFHHHQSIDEKIDPRVALVIIGDTLHNFIDGIAIASGFLTSFEAGVVVTIVVAVHEIPQEIGDFGLLLSKGLSRKKVILINLISATITIVGAGMFYMIGRSIQLPKDIIIGLVAGFFIYIAVSDIIPTIHKYEERNLAGVRTLMLLIGAIVVSIITIYLNH